MKITSRVGKPYTIQTLDVSCLGQQSALSFRSSLSLSEGRASDFRSTFRKRSGRLQTVDKLISWAREYPREYPFGSQGIRAKNFLLYLSGQEAYRQTGNRLSTISESGNSYVESPVAKKLRAGESQAPSRFRFSISQISTSSSRSPFRRRHEYNWLLGNALVFCCPTCRETACGSEVAIESGRS
eukprot:1192270-Prorocentrum_minimum.AAC.10